MRNFVVLPALPVILWIVPVPIRLVRVFVAGMVPATLPNTHNTVPHNQYRRLIFWQSFGYWYPFHVLFSV